MRNNSLTFRPLRVALAILLNSTLEFHYMYIMVFKNFNHDSQRGSTGMFFSSPQVMSVFRVTHGPRSPPPHPHPHYNICSLDSFSPFKCGAADKMSNAVFQEHRELLCEVSWNHKEAKRKAAVPLVAGRGSVGMG